jgi:hypothetical protein
VPQGWKRQRIKNIAHKGVENEIGKIRLQRY